jgi:hypothetical protein
LIWVVIHKAHLSDSRRDSSAGLEAAMRGGVREMHGQEMTVSGGESIPWMTASQHKDISQSHNHKESHSDNSDNLEEDSML